MTDLTDFICFLSWTPDAKLHAGADSTLGLTESDKASYNCNCPSRLCFVIHLSIPRRHLFVWLCLAFLTRLSENILQNSLHEWEQDEDLNHFIIWSSITTWIQRHGVAWQPLCWNMADILFYKHFLQLRKSVQINHVTRQLVCCLLHRRSGPTSTIYQFQEWCDVI